jgi:hypothetical protein
MLDNRANASTPRPRTALLIYARVRKTGLAQLGERLVRNQVDNFSLSFSRTET